MQLFSAHAALGLLIAIVITVILLAAQVPVIVAVIVGGFLGWLLVRTVLRDVADRAERWLTTPK